MCIRCWAVAGRSNPAVLWSPTQDDLNPRSAWTHGILSYRPFMENSGLTVSNFPSVIRAPSLGPMLQSYPFRCRIFPPCLHPHHIHTSFSCSKMCVYQASTKGLQRGGRERLRFTNRTCKEQGQLQKLRTSAARFTGSHSQPWERHRSLLVRPRRDHSLHP